MTRWLPALALLLSFGIGRAASAGDSEKCDQQSFAALVKTEASRLAATCHRLAEQGDANAEVLLGTLYEVGEGVERDSVEAVKWYRKAADKGCPFAQDILATVYASGVRGVVQDYAEAVKWDRLGADQGFADSQFHLGLYYYGGLGVTLSYIEAAKWYRKAADQGQGLAQANLGYMYYHGEGVGQDFVQAYMWYDLAVASGVDEGVKALGLLASQMASSQIAEAIRLAAAWRPTPAAWNPLRQLNCLPLDQQNSSDQTGTMTTDGKLTGPNRDSFISSATQSCIATHSNDQTLSAAGISQDTIASFCKCTAGKLADLITAEDLKYWAINNRGSESVMTKAHTASAACALIVNPPSGQ